MTGGADHRKEPVLSLHRRNGKPRRFQQFFCSLSLNFKNCKTAKYNTKGVSVQSHNLCKTRHISILGHRRNNTHTLNDSNCRMETNSNINQGHNTNWPSKVLRVNQKQFLQRSDHACSIHETGNYYTLLKKGGITKWRHSGLVDIAVLRSNLHMNNGWHLPKPHIKLAFRCCFQNLSK
jgi:hypothetical protein